MIDRYTEPKMTGVWSWLNKFDTWLKVELAVIEVKVNKGIIPREALQIRLKSEISCREHIDLRDELFKNLGEAGSRGIIGKKTINILAQKLNDFLSTERIREIEEDVRHDMIAFVMAVQESLPEGLKKYVHSDVTSYDIEEPTLSLIILEAMELIFAELRELLTIIWTKAFQYKSMARIERSHGQFAEPNTLGLVFLGWYDALERQIYYLSTAYEQMKYSKISGAVGTYTGNLSPELEKSVLKELGLMPARFSSQIIMRDRHSHLMNALAVLAGVIEHIALNIRILGRQEICEVQEPFAETQKGSSRMPQKKNPVRSERLCGLSRIARSNAAAALENIPTWDARDISPSSVERIIIPDTFQLVYFMLKELKGIIKGLVVNEDKIERNLEMTNYIFFAPEVKELLMTQNIDPETAYRIVQVAAFNSQRERTSEERLPEDVFLNELRKIEAVINSGLMESDFRELFDLRSKLKHIDKIFDRFCLKEGKNG